MPSSTAPRTAWLAVAGAALLVPALPAAEPGLLFHLSGEHGTTAEVSAGHRPEPTYERGIEKIPDGAQGAALQCADTQLLAYRAPGNIYAQRGTLAFFWRPRDAVGPTAFPVFRVAYSDHSSWDMVWLRIDYNGHGFDAFVTDASLSRLRVSVTVDPFPAPLAWTHLALAWDETRGIRFFVNGRLVASVDQPALLDAGLDQFGPHSRIISPYQVQSDYNFVRGGDIDELRIYDRLLDDDAVAALARGEGLPAPAAAPARDLTQPGWRQEWWWRYGWNRPDDPPPYLADAHTAVRKVEIHDAYDLKRWWWKANDGIRETTWPGVFNRSRLPGRLDYFVLPDWDCYSLSGQAVTFTLPDEPWNHLEISGAAWGAMSLLGADGTVTRLFDRPRGQERTYHTLPDEIRGQQIRFENEMPEQPIGELAAYDVGPGQAPAGAASLSFTLRAAAPANPTVAALSAYVEGRFPADERAVLIGQPAGAAPAAAPASPAAAAAAGTLPLVHVFLPDTWDDRTDGLDGIVLELPALDVRPTHGSYFPLNIRVKDPLWPPRDLLDFSCSLKPGEARTVWLDLRDRLLPASRGLYLTIAGAGPGLGAAELAGASVRLVFKPREAARAEHESDRFTQARDSYAMLVEEHPNNPRLDLWNRFRGDLEDLLRVNPAHERGREYAAAALPGAPRPEFTPPEPPAGVPVWAFRQTEVLAAVERFVEWYIDHRQIENGEFGGGLSDDTDLTNTWPGVALMGCLPEKITESLRREAEACYAQGMFTNGLPTIQADELHSYEEGINGLAQIMLLDYGRPLWLERAMETTRGVAGITGVNAAGHRHIRTAYYSGTKMATEGVWGWSKNYSYLVLHPGYLLTEYNGNPAARQLIVDLADGLLAHRHADDAGRFSLPSAVEFASDANGVYTRGAAPWPLFWAAWKWTGERRFLAPLFDMGPRMLSAVNANAVDLLHLRDTLGAEFLATPAPEGRGGGRGGRGQDRHLTWQLTGDKAQLAELYGEQLATMARMNYINTEGSLWIDRVSVPYADVQRARLGGLALVRNSLFPGHAVSWRFAAPATARSVAILIPDATSTALTVIACNLETVPVHATLTAWNLDPGLWEITQGIDTDDDDQADGPTTLRPAQLERGADVALTFAPRATTILKLRRTLAAAPYWERADLGIEPADITREGDQLRVTVHSLGSVPTSPTEIALRNRDGRVLASAALPVMAAPVDLMPTRLEVALPFPPGTDLDGATVELDPDARLTEITRRNNRVTLPADAR